MPTHSQTITAEPIELENYTSTHSGDPLAINGFAYIEIYAESQKQSAFFLSRAFGFSPVSYKGLETGSKDKTCLLMRQGNITLIISSPLHSDSEIAEHVRTHGFSVKDVAFDVPDAVLAYKEAISRGATSAIAPMRLTDEKGSIVRSAIKTYGDTIHSFISREGYPEDLLPGFVPYSKVFPKSPIIPSAGLVSIDHVVGNVELGKMDEWVSFYERILGFSQRTHFTDDDISTEYSALMSKVMFNGNGRIKLPINEPAEGKRKSQIEEYLDFHEGPGVQHIAFLTDNIIDTVSALRDNGVRFLFVPKTYYDHIPERVGAIKEDLETISALGILVDRDEDGYLLQIFTKTLQDRPTLFFEIIQREGSQGFGVGNFKALFEAIERDQAARGNL